MKFIVNRAIATLAVVAGFLMHAPKASAGEVLSCKAMAKTSAEYRVANAQEVYYNNMLEADYLLRNHIVGKKVMIQSIESTSNMFGNPLNSTIEHGQQLANNYVIAEAKVKALIKEALAAHEELQASGRDMDDSNSPLLDCLESNLKRVGGIEKSVVGSLRREGI